jgi:hypothetical protein
MATDQIMKRVKEVLKNNFSTLAYFYKHLRYRIIVSLGLNIVVGILDGFGLAMFLPLLQLVNESGAVDAEGLGNLDFLLTLFHLAGVEITLMSILVFILIFFVMKGFALFCQEYYLVAVQQYFIKGIRKENLQLLNHLSYKAFVLSNVGQVQNTLTGEMDRMGRAYVTYFTTIQQAILVAVYMGFAFTVDAQFAILVTLGGGLTNLIYNRINKNTREASYQLSQTGNVFQSLVIQFISSYKYLKATNYSSRYLRKLLTGVDDIEASGKRIGNYAAVLRATREPLIIAVVTVVIFFKPISSVHHWDRFLSVYCFFIARFRI